MKSRVAPTIRCCGGVVVDSGSGRRVVAYALVPVAFLKDTSNLADPVFAYVTVVTGNGGETLFYYISDSNNTFSYSGSGSIPASSVNVSGGSVNAGKVTVTLNVNTCDVAGFTTNLEPCGTFDVTFVEVPPSLGGSTATRGDKQQRMPGGGKVVTNGSSWMFSALATGTALYYSFTSGGGTLTQQTNVTVTFPAP